MYAAAAKSLQSSLTLWDPIDGSPPGSPVPGILQARTLEWVAISFFNAWKWKVKWSCSVVPDSSDPMDCSPPGSSVHGIFQAKVLEWGAIASLSAIFWNTRHLCIIVGCRVLVKNRLLNYFFPWFPYFFLNRKIQIHWIRPTHIK